VGVTIPEAFGLALQYEQTGRLREAEAMYRRILAVDPRHAASTHRLGLLAQTVGRMDLAMEWLQRALILDPGDPSVPYHLGQIYSALGRASEANACFRRAVEIKPDFSEAKNEIGIALVKEGRYEEAAEIFEAILAIQPDYVYGHLNLGVTLEKRGRSEEAIAAYRKVIEIEPGQLEAHNNLGAALLKTSRVDEALAALEFVARGRPDDPTALCNWSSGLRAKGRFEEAITAIRRAIEQCPDDAGFHWNAAMTFLMAGRLREGWEEFEWRTKLPHLARPDLTAPQWRGEDISGLTLLIHQEGGFGDVLHFMRYLPLVRAGGVTRVIFEGKSPILPLMKIQPEVDDVVERGQSLPAHDFQCAPQSFPRLFGTDLDSVPATVPYLAIDEEKRSAWRRELSGLRDREGEKRPFLVGLCWAGSEKNLDPRSRTREVFAPLARVPGVTFVSLQKGAAAAAAQAGVPTELKLLDAAAKVKDFSDLAALVSCLDAVASVDTSVAHLSGALGIPTWTLIPQCQDFRWLAEREDSPWYPTMRLFRQKKSPDWEEPVERMVAELRARIS